MPMKQPETVGDSLPLDIHAPRMNLDVVGLVSQERLLCL